MVEQTQGPPGIFKTIVTIFGGAIVGGAISFFLALAFLLSSAPKKGAGIALSRDGFIFGSVVAIGVAVLVLVVGLYAWLAYGRKDEWLAGQVNELWESAWVRFFGITTTLGAGTAVLFVVLEYALATEEYPPKWHELPEVVAGAFILIVCGYLLVLFLAFLWRKLFR